jgi:hypothetical protein
VSEYAFRAALCRLTAVLVVLGICLLSDRWEVALPLVACASIAPVGNIWWVGHVTAGRTTSSRLVLRFIDHVEAQSGRHQMTVLAYFDMAGTVALLATASWILTDIPAAARIAALVAGGCYWASTATGVFADHSWFNPAEVPPRWHEWLRPVAGPVAAALMAALVLPAPWREEERLAAALVCLLPLVVSVRVADTDLTMRYVGDLVREQAHEGRELVLREAHGALSTQLRLIVQFARGHRNQLPRLYDLAVGADARLRELLMLAEVDRDTSRSVQTLAAPVTALGRAVGATTEVDIAVDSLSSANHDLARLVLVDLVGNALSAGALRVRARLTLEEGVVGVLVHDDARPMPEAVWQSAGTSSHRLARQLHDLAGSLTVQHGEGGKVVAARWSAESCDSRPG